MTGKNDSMAMLGWKIPLMLLIWSVIVIGACSDTSPLYSFYPSPDPSIFFMFGRGLLHGLLPYVEMADRRGPCWFGFIMPPRGLTGIHLPEYSSFSA